MSYQERMNTAKAAALLASSECFVGNRENAETFIEQVIEAATARVFLDLDAEGKRRHRAEAVAVLGDDLCGECVELLTPEAETAPTGIGIGDPNIPGSVELAERDLFLSWHNRIAEVGEGLAEDGPRFALICELHASMGDRHPLGIAENIGQAIGALHAGDDDEARATLDDLAAAELGAAKIEKGGACLEALRVLVDPELDDDQARGLIADWTMAELVAVLTWAEVAFKCATISAGAGADAARMIPAIPEVVAAFKRATS